VQQVSPNINTREFFLPDMMKGKEQIALRVLQGINEVHHTLANWLVNYLEDALRHFPLRS
jgi:hypothetical protein